MPKPTRHDPLPTQPTGLAWPTSAWPEAPPADDVDSPRLDRLLSDAFGPRPELDLTLATAIVHRGQLVAERYGETAGPDEQLISWSKGKSITHALVGLLALDGKIDIHQPAPIPEWADDERAAITVHDLLTMTPGLEFCEDYVDDQISHVIEMLFGEGKADVAGYARSFPLIHEPGTVHNYSSGTTNIVSGICGDIIAGAVASPTERVEKVTNYLRERLFQPLGMASADPRFDDAGTFIGSSFVYATARDFLRFGYLYLRDGMWEGERLLPEGWADAARRPVDPEVEPPFWYGAHWWLWDDRTGAFGAHGYEGQFTIVVPSRDLVVVRLGKTPAERRDHLIDWMHDLISCFPEG